MMKMSVNEMIIRGAVAHMDQKTLLEFGKILIDRENSKRKNQAKSKGSQLELDLKATPIERDSELNFSLPTTKRKLGRPFKGDERRVDKSITIPASLLDKLSKELPKLNVSMQIEFAFRFFLDKGA